MKKKKILLGILIALFVAVLLVTCLASCEEKDQQTDATTPTESTTGSTAEVKPEEVDMLLEIAFDEELQLPVSLLTLQMMMNETKIPMILVGAKGEAGSFNAKLWSTPKAIILNSPDLSKNYGVSYEKVVAIIGSMLPPEIEDMPTVTDGPLSSLSTITSLYNQETQEILTDFVKETLETFKKHAKLEKSETDKQTTLKISLTGESIVAFLDDFFADLKSNPKMLAMIDTMLASMNIEVEEFIDSWLAADKADKIGSDDSNHILHDSTLVSFEITTAKEQNTQKIHIAFDYQPTKNSGSLKGTASLVLEENSGFEVTVTYAIPGQPKTELLHILHKAEEKNSVLSGKLTVSANFGEPIDNMTILQWEYNKKTGAFSLEIPAADSKITGTIKFSLTGPTLKDIRLFQDGQDLGITVSVTIKNKVTQDITPPTSFEEIDLNDLMEGNPPAFLGELQKNPLIAAILSSMGPDDTDNDLAA